MVCTEVSNCILDIRNVLYTLVVFVMDGYRHISRCYWSGQYIITSNKWFSLY